MCGITGIASFDSGPPIEPAILEKMVAVIHHRGPDDRGIEVRDKVGLGVTRLSVIDVEGGHQPIHNEDGSIRLVFNGEIYNYRELRRQLIENGHRFSTESDTEVIVHAYEEFGDAFVDLLNGMFGFALHDVPNRRVVLARDPLGIKPLYYYCNKDHLVWGSEVKSILASGLVPRDLDADALAAFLAWEYVPSPLTLMRNVRKLPAGSLMSVDLDRPDCRPVKYWSISRSDDEHRMSDTEWLERIDERLRVATRAQLVSDVPLGAFLSGGVDSSLVAAHMGPIATFSIGFDDPSYDELKWAERVADHLNVPNINETIRPDVRQLFEQLVYHNDDPIADFSIFPTFLVSQLARKHVTVVLSGDGGDELFGGYETYAAHHMARQYARVPALIRERMIEPVVAALRPGKEKKGVVNKSKRFVEGLSHPEALRHARWRLFAGEDVLSTLLTVDLQEQRTHPVTLHITDLFEEASVFSDLNQMLYVDVYSYLVDNILTKVDRMSMAVSLEARVPYLDKHLVDLAFRVPDRLKVDGKKTKVGLKTIASRHVPRECVYREKQGFSIPIKNWLTGALRPTLEEHLDESAIRQDGIFRWNTISTLKKEHLSGRANHSHLLWALIVFHAWRKRWYDG